MEPDQRVWDVRSRLGYAARASKLMDGSLSTEPLRHAATVAAHLATAEAVLLAAGEITAALARLTLSLIHISEPTRPTT